MPLFDFKCEDCGQTVEVLAKDFHAADKEAPACNCPKRPRMIRQMSVFAAPPDYLDKKYFGTPQYADARSKECGIGSL